MSQVFFSRITILNDRDFKELIYELAFGDEAINRDFNDLEVIAKIREYSDNSLKLENQNEL